MYNIIPYKSNVVHDEDDILNFSPIRQKINYYPRKENNFGDDYSMVLLDYNHLGETIIARNTDLRDNIILESIDLVLSSRYIGLHTGDTKYSI